ncbi:hypothetical protein BS78_03G153900 [Paspalum vaginatum]|nr:hypothetical protein BS78_03G153900 [Paspalum vaginatum]
MEADLGGRTTKMRGQRLRWQIRAERWRSRPMAERAVPVLALCRAHRACVGKRSRGEEEGSGQWWADPGGGRDAVWRRGEAGRAVPWGGGGRRRGRRGVAGRAALWGGEVWGCGRTGKDEGTRSF